MRPRRCIFKTADLARCRVPHPFAFFAKGWEFKSAPIGQKPSDHLI